MKTFIDKLLEADRKTRAKAEADWVADLPRQRREESAQAKAWADARNRGRERQHQQARADVIAGRHAQEMQKLREEAEADRKISERIAAHFDEIDGLIKKLKADATAAREQESAKMKALSSIELEHSFDPRVGDSALRRVVYKYADNSESYNVRRDGLGHIVGLDPEQAPDKTQGASDARSSCGAGVWPQPRRDDFDEPAGNGREVGLVKPRNGT